MSNRLVNPGTAFCSSSIVGTPRSAATMTTGPELYPPTPITSDGRRADTIRQPSTRLIGTSAAPRARSNTDFPFTPLLRITSSVNPSRGTTRASIPRAVPANVTVAAGRLASSSRATAIPG